jgi:hypothetical protein
MSLRNIPHQNAIELEETAYDVAGYGQFALICSILQRPLP